MASVEKKKLISAMESSVEQLDVQNDDNDKQEDKPRQQHSLLYKIIKTMCQVLIWFCMGLWSEVNGATIYDVMYRTHANYATISASIAVRGSGTLSAALLGVGYLMDRFHYKVELIVALALLVCATVNAIVPYCNSIAPLVVIYLVEGWMEMVVNIGGLTIIMDIWDSQASGPLHLVHIGYGIGAFVVPQIAKHFISNDLPEKRFPIFNADGLQQANCCNQSGMINGSSAVNLTTTGTLSHPSETLQYCFLIISAIITATAVVWLCYFFYERKCASRTSQDLSEPKERFNLNTCLPGHPVFVFIIYVFLFFWIYVSVAGERLIGKYLYAFARQEAGFGKYAASNLLTAFWVSLAVGRIAGFVFANFVPMKFIIFIEGLGNLLGVLLLYIFHASATILWVSMCILGFFIGPSYLSGLAWSNRYIMVTPTGLTVLPIAMGISEVSLLPTVGYFVEKLGINVLPPFLLGYGIIFSALPILMQSIACTRSDRFENENSSTDKK